MNSLENVTLTEQVNTLLEHSDLPATLTIEQCALAFGISMTSFRRKLSQEETSYKIIQSKFLNELCIKGLLQSHIKIDALFIKLGYSERATFERSFRQKFGLTPSQFRKLSLIGTKSENKQDLTNIAQTMPPLAASCQQLLNEKNNEDLNIHSVTAIVEADPIYSGRVMGLASKAIYGKTPSNINEAISRNLGINTVINVAIVYAVKDMLDKHIDANIINRFTKTFLKAPKLFQLIRKSAGVNIKFDVETTEQSLTFALLGVFLLSHKSASKYELMLHSLKGIDDLHTLNHYLSQAMGTSLLSASSMMLSLWHMDAKVIKHLMYLDKVMLQGAKNKEDELVIFMLSCLYAYAVKSTDTSELSRYALQLNITDYPDIHQLLFVDG